MSKWVGNIGYETYEKSADGFYEPVIVERHYRGEVMNNNWRRNQGESINDNINVSMSIKITADPFTLNNVGNILYITYMNSKWKVTNVRPDRPSLMLDIGGLYNENME